MKRLSMLVTPDGEWVLENSGEFLAALGDPDPDYDAVSFAVKNHGFIKFQVLDQSVVEIELHPYTVELPALLAVQQQLLTSKVKLFRIRYLERTWLSEIFPSAELVVTRLSELCAPKFLPVPEERFVVEPQDYSSLFADEENWLRPIIRKWRSSFGQFDPSVISFAIQHQFLSRMMIFGVKPRQVDPIFRFIGGGFMFLKNDYPLVGLGEKVGNQPDKEYGEWVSEFYKNVAGSGQPRYDRVTAAIQIASKKPKLLTARYERLLLPWKTSSDEVLVSMMSKRLADEDGEFEVAEPAASLSRMSAKSS